MHDIDKGSKEFIEDFQDSVTYTLNDLREIGENLALNYTEFRDYMAKVNLIASHPAWEGIAQQESRILAK